jgi:hypothetical protein
LINIGNTCFMNKSTQWAKEQKQHSSTQNRDIIYAYRSLIWSMWSSENNKINLRNT